MAKQVPFHITSGIPFGKTIVVTLPNGRDWWTALNEFEVLAQIREAEDYLSPIVLDLTQFLTVTFDGTDEVSIDLEMTGEDTRMVAKSGYYDIVMSDIYAIDVRAFIVVKGAVHRGATVTADTEELTF